MLAWRALGHEPLLLAVLMVISTCRKPFNSVGTLKQAGITVLARCLQGSNRVFTPHPASDTSCCLPHCCPPLARYEANPSLRRCIGPHPTTPGTTCRPELSPGHCLHKMLPRTKQSTDQMPADLPAYLNSAEMRGTASHTGYQVNQGTVRVL